MGGMYGDLIYHHGAGSRPLVSFWDEAGTNESRLRNRRIGDISAHFLYTDYNRYVAFLMGGDAGELSAWLHALSEGSLDDFADIPVANDADTGMTQTLTTRRKSSKVIRRCRRVTKRLLAMSPVRQLAARRLPQPTPHNE